MSEGVGRIIQTAAEAQGKRQALAVSSHAFSHTHVNFIQEEANLLCLVLVHRVQIDPPCPGAD